MSSDALIQLGIVSVGLNSSQTEISKSGSSASPMIPRLRVPACAAAPRARLHRRVRAASDLPAPAGLHHARQHPSLLRSQRRS
ncbi:MAG TPA: hypothetical protein P5163_06645 [Rubrivivax sp.]|nr:hypothetical protein [Pseudomonadota bacterium]HOW48642.1 hypothetical protein [Rubrivivax sp.]HRY86295.1 hypothetical protein [Rubrivivax sp.]HRZ60257.1 hypothetical protein [Rubrivivax sp.]